jgi:hypothetical protein
MLAYLFVVFAIVARFLVLQFPQMWLNFTPVGASLLFFGARGPRKHAWPAVLLLAGSDVVLTKLVYGYPYTPDHFATIAWYAAVIAMGTLLRKNAGPARVLGAALGTSVSFFVLSNFAVWMVWNMYPHNLTGLFACYAAAVPFFRNQVVSDLLFTTVMFSIPAVIELLRPAKVAKA